MSMWIRAVCTRTVAQVTAAALQYQLEGMDFWTTAEACGLDDSAGDAARAALRVRQDEARPGVMYLHYRPEPARAIRIDRWSDAEAVVDEVEELRDRVGGRHAARIDDVLARTCEVVAFELKASDADAMGWPLAFHGAMHLAEVGRGLVEAEGEWWDPVAWVQLEI